jgi:hypothetical protein
VPILALTVAVGRDLLKIESPRQCTVRDIEARNCVHRAPQWIRAQCLAQCSAPSVQCGGENMETLKGRVCRVELAVNQKHWRELDCPVVTSRTPPWPCPNLSDAGATQGPPKFTRHRPGALLLNSALSHLATSLFCRPSSHAALVEIYESN